MMAAAFPFRSSRRQEAGRSATRAPQPRYLGCYGHGPQTAGFTLIEMLVVIGLIVALIGWGALALAGRGGTGAALRNSQGVIAGLIGTARAQAALHQTNSRLLVYAQRPPGGDARKYLRALQVVRETMPGTNQFFAVGDPVTLPEPICVVPSPSMPRDHLNPDVTWPTNPAPVSTMDTVNGFSYLAREGTGAQRMFFGQANVSGQVLYLQFGPDGRCTRGDGKIAVSTAVLSPSALPKFDNPGAVRGTILRRTGAVSFVDQQYGF